MPLTFVNLHFLTNSSAFKKVIIFLETLVKRKSFISHLIMICVQNLFPYRTSQYTRLDLHIDIIRCDDISNNSKSCLAQTSVNSLFFDILQSQTIRITSEAQ